METNMTTTRLTIPGQDKEQLFEIIQSLAKGEFIALHELVERGTLRPYKTNLFIFLFHSPLRDDAQPFIHLKP